MEKQEMMELVARRLGERGFTVVESDFGRPWGGFFVIAEDQAPQFIETYFPGLSLSDFEGFSRLSPKILVVAPHQRLSWQYHHRRAEIWRLVQGTAGVVTSLSDEQGGVQRLQLGDLVRLEQGQRHRLVGLDDWGVIAEIWQHTESENPSDENDIVRLQDDFGR